MITCLVLSFLLSLPMLVGCQTWLQQYLVILGHLGLVHGLLWGGDWLMRWWDYPYTITETIDGLTYRMRVNRDGTRTLWVTQEERCLPH